MNLGPRIRPLFFRPSWLIVIAFMFAKSSLAGAAPHLLRALGTDGMQALVMERDGSARIVDTGGGTTLWQSPALETPPAVVAASAMGRFAVSVTNNGATTWIDSSTRQVTHCDATLGVVPRIGALNSDGSRFFLGSADGQGETINPMTCVELGRQSLPALVFARSAALEPAPGSMIYVPSWLEVVRVQPEVSGINKSFRDEIELGNISGMISPQRSIMNTIHSLALSTDGTMLAVGYINRVVVFDTIRTRVVFNETVPVEIARLSYQASVYAVALHFMAGGSRLAVLAASGEIRIWDLSNHAAEFSVMVPDISTIQVSPNAATPPPIVDFAADDESFIYVDSLGAIRRFTLSSE